MNLPDWIHPAAAGFYCRPGDFYLDPRLPVRRAVISHGHADHYARGIGEAYATAPTLAFGKLRYRHSEKQQFFPQEYQSPFEIGPVKISLWQAGHILGSAQVLMEFESQKILFSGDIQTSPDPTCEELAIPNTPIDTLICESTFGLKETHPEPMEEIRNCLQASGDLPLLIGVYPCGKAQFINRIFSDHFPELPVLIHPDIQKFHSVYEKFGVSPGQYLVAKHSVLRNQPGKFIYLVPARYMSSYRRDNRFFKVMASGWDQRKNFAHLNGWLDISGHASFSGLRDYLKQVGPKQVAFWHGYSGELRQLSNSLNIQAIHVNLPAKSTR